MNLPTVKVDWWFTTLGGLGLGYLEGEVGIVWLFGYAGLAEAMVLPPCSDFE